MKINPGKSYWDFEHDKVIEKFNCTKYIGEFDVGGNYPVAIYYSETPDRSKGHKDYISLTHYNGTLYIGGKNSDDMEKFRFRTALLCEHCNTLIYSTYRHNMRSCECESEEDQCSIDGGKDYNRISYGKNAKYKTVKFDILDQKIVD